MARKSYTTEFRDAAVKMVLEQKRQVNEAARSLGVLPTTLRFWIKSHRERAGSLDAAEEKALRKKVRELEVENAKLRMEREILKNPLRGISRLSDEKLGARYAGGRSGRSGRLLFGDDGDPVKKHGPGKLAHLALVTPSR